MSDVPENLVIRASAGSGKTFALSNQYLKLIRHGAEPASILATTFTRKAAGEILGRVLRRLAKAALDKTCAAALASELKDPAIELPEARRMLQKVAGALHQVHVSTIDAFFNLLTSCFRYELGLPPSPSLVADDGPQARQLRRRAIDAMLADDDPGILVEWLRRLHHDTTQRRLSDALDEIFAGLYGIFRQTTKAAWMRLKVPRPLNDRELSDALNRLAGAGCLVDGSSSVTKAWQADLTRATDRDWPAFLGKGIAAKVAAGQGTYARRPLPKELADAYQDVIDHARAALVARVAHQTEATFELLQRFDKHYTRLRQEQRVILFGDLPHLLGQELDNSTEALEDLYFRLDARVQHLLLDEFQDTSGLQWRILRPFAEQIRAHEHEGRSFFCVGDVKQAIFGWREGRAEIFENMIEDLGLGPDAQHTLSVSFRSSQVILDVVNKVFAQIAEVPPLAALAGDAKTWQSGFETHRAHFSDRQGYVQLVATPATDNDDHSDRDALAHLRFVAERVANLAQAHPTRTIGVLLRTNKTAAAIIHLLQGMHVRASGEAARRFDTDPAVELVLSALTMADHPGHSAAVFGVYHSPLAATIGLKSCAPSHAAEIGRHIRRELMDEGYASVITRWAAALIGLCNGSSAERLTQLVELADQHDPTLTLRVRDFVEQVRQTPVEEPVPSRIRVMTTHKAKGLQFDITVLGEFSALIGQVRGQLAWAFRPKPSDPPTAVFRSVRKPMLPPLFQHEPVLAQAYHQEVSQRVADDLSVLYVAMTRARFAMILIVEPLRPTQRGLSTKGLHNASAAAILRHQLTDVSRPAIDGVLYEHGDPEWDKAAPATTADQPEAEPPKLELATDHKPVRSWPVLIPSALQGVEEVQVGRLFDLGEQGARAYGSRIHQQLERIEYLEGFDEAAASEELRRILAQPAVRRVLARGRDTDELWRERPFAVRDGDHLLRGTFDRVIVQRDPATGSALAATLIDFKTDTAERSSLDAIVDHYRPQVEAYRRAVSILLNLVPRHIDAQMVFLSTGHVAQI